LLLTHRHTQTHTHVQSNSNTDKTAQKQNSLLAHTVQVAYSNYSRSWCKTVAVILCGSCSPDPSLSGKMCTDLPPTFYYRAAIHGL